MFRLFCALLKSVIDLFNYSNGENNVLLYKISKTCTQRFSRYDQTKSFTCMLMPTLQNETAPVELQQRGAYESLIIKLDINYGPETDPSFNLTSSNYNKTIVVGSSQIIAFTCPFSGNPTPNYYWRVASVSTDNQTNLNEKVNRRQLTQTNGFSLSTQAYTVPSNLQIGAYVFECYAQVGGLINNSSAVVQFRLNVLRNE